MHSSRINLYLARALALVGWAALIVQCYLSVRTQQQLGHSAAYGVFMYAGYFTILSNAFCALVATACARNTPSLEFWRQPWVVTAAATAIVMVGIVFHLLLSKTYQPTGLPAVTNLIHHYLVPTVFAVFWWRVVPRGALVWSDVWRVGAYPAAYLVYIAARGEMTGVYPYWFVDVATIGYANALRNSAGLAVVFGLASLMFVAVKRGAGGRE